VLWAGVTALLMGCSGGTTRGNSPEPPKAAEGRPDTKAVKALDAVGYDGDKVRQKLDNTLNKTEQRNKDLEDAVQGMDGK
jgi:hypothetical protein